jgi:hypothetical protein
LDLDDKRWPARPVVASPDHLAEQLVVGLKSRKRRAGRAALAGLIATYLETDRNPDLESLKRAQCAMDEALGAAGAARGPLVSGRGGAFEMERFDCGKAHDE